MLTVRTKIALWILAVFACATPAVVSAAESVKEADPQKVVAPAYEIVFRKPMTAEQIEELRRAFESFAQAQNKNARAYAERHQSGGVTIIIMK